MPSKINPNDWDRLFAPNGPWRGGPLRTFMNIILTLVLLALLSGGAVFLLNVRAERVAQAITATAAAAPTVATIRTATAQADLNATATLIAARAATAVAKPTPGALTASVANGGNVREAPINGRPVDQVRAGEVVQLLEKNQDSSWFKVTYARNGQSITGWISRTLLTIAPEVEQQVP